jgi:hypothetical protein
MKEHNGYTDSTSQAFDALTGPGDSSAIIGYYRRLALESRGGASIGAVAAPLELVRSLAPESSSTTTIHTMSGACLSVGEDRSITVTPEDAAPLE